MMRSVVTAILRIIAACGRRGAAALEFVLIAPIMITLLLALLDIGMAGMRLISCYEAMSGVASYLLQNPPPDVTNIGSWLPAQAPSGMRVSLQCAGAACTTSTANLTPKTFQLSQTVKISATLMTYLAGSYTVTYSGRLQ
ncbi:hypothetical protein CCS01_29815 [Rhodopila globiformis]|uniref:TadE-like domain-containing protein n=1 Tax=Rhodopila globiformis TaxID=1071 RepID=A0A2S6MW11_RHOGL|nr:hypothetical protein CCS01_29815 [Rhodopila globiformis]